MSGVNLFIGCDPGASGALAAVDADGVPRGWIRGDATDRDLLDWLLSLGTLRMTAGMLENAFAVLEEVGPKPRIGGDGQRVSMGAKSAFTFGGSYRALAMALTAVGVPFERVLPAKWQAAMRCLSRGDKNVTKRRAQELFPGTAIRITHQNADALLLAEYARRLRLGDGARGPAANKETQGGQ